MAEVADGILEARLDTVKRGFDPQQVKRLVGTLSAELKELDAENTTLKHELEVARLNPSVTTSRATDDIISSWTRETSEMLDGARQHVSRIMDKANTDAASVVAEADADAAVSRRRAQVDADQIVAQAQAHAAELIRETEQERQSIRQQLVDMQAYLQGLVATIEPQFPAERVAPTTRTANP